MWPHTLLHLFQGPLCLVFCHLHPKCTTKTGSRCCRGGIKPGRWMWPKWYETGDKTIPVKGWEAGRGVNVWRERWLGQHAWTHRPVREGSANQRPALQTQTAANRAAKETGLEVERLSQIKTQRTDQLAIHMCLFNKSASLCPDMPQV